MGYSKEIYAKAINALQDEAAAKKQKFNIKKQELYLKEPKLIEIENEMMHKGANLGAVALSGNLNALKTLQNELTSLTEQKAKILKANNFFEYTPVCAKCNDSGFIDGKYCDCIKKRAVNIAFCELNDGVSLENYGFDKFSLEYYPEEFKNGVKKALEACKDFAENFNGNKNLILLGNTGLGKTHLSLSIAKEVISKGFSVVYGPSDNILSKIEKEHFSYSSTTPFKDNVLNCDLLILDDLGTEFLTQYTLSTIYNIINNRLISGKATIISTNFSIDELEKKYTPRVTSRILGSYTTKLLKGNDIRQLKK